MSNSEACGMRCASDAEECWCYTDAMEAELIARRSRLAQGTAPWQVDEVKEESHTPVIPGILETDAGDQLDGDELLL